MVSWCFRSARKVDSPMTARSLKPSGVVHSVSKPGKRLPLRRGGTTFTIVGSADPIGFGEVTMVKVVPVSSMRASAPNGRNSLLVAVVGRHPPPINMPLENA
jgi:hypothetical protein